MIRRSIRLVWTGVVLAFLAYVLFFVQLGERSAFGHLMRVIKTDEAQELGREVSAATERIALGCGLAMQNGPLNHPIRVAEPGNRKNQHTILHTDEITVAEVGDVLSMICQPRVTSRPTPDN